jgi:uncharacterized protein DUF5615
VPSPRFLIDENLSPNLVTAARDRGFEAMAVRDLGLLSARDAELIGIVERDDWTLVTNNTGEFRRRYRRHLALHAGVVFLHHVAGLASTMDAFLAALDDIEIDHDLTNTEVLVEHLGQGRYRVSRFDLP